MIDRSPFCSPIGGWNKYLILFQNTGNLPQSVPVQTKDKYPFDYFGSFGSNHSLLFDFRVFPASVRWGVAEMFPGFAFRLHHCANFLAGIFGVPRVDDIEKRGEVAILLVCARNVVVDSNNPHVFP